MKPATWLSVSAFAVGAVLAVGAAARSWIHCCNANGPLYYGHIPSGALTLNWSRADFDNFSDWTGHFQQAAQAWTSVAEASVVVTAQRDTDTTVGFNNSQSEVAVRAGVDPQLVTVGAQRGQ
jgi:hypothetical protein